MSLHIVIDNLHRFIKVGAIILLSSILLFFLVKIGTGIKEYFFPTPDAPPTVSFGKLPQIEFPANTPENIVDKQLEFSIDTLTGTLPIFPDRVTIFKTEFPQQNLLALKRAEAKASSLGLPPQGRPLSESVYVWRARDDSKTLSLDILTENFQYFLSSQAKDQLLKTSAFNNKEEAARIAQEFIGKIRPLPDDIDKEKTTSTVFTYNDGGLIPATSIANTQTIRVDFFQKSIEDLPIVYPDNNLSSMYVLVAGTNNNPAIAQADFYYYVVKKDQSATYPIKTSDKAFKELKEGKGYIAFFSEGGDTIAIKNMQLGYFVGKFNQGYLLPVFIFEGSDNFSAYIPAVVDEWIE